MNINYYLVPWFTQGNKVRSGSSDRTGPQKTFIKTLLALFVLLVGVTGAQAQTTLIDPAGDGGFEDNGSSNAANNFGWTKLTASQNNWVYGNPATVGAASNAAYVSNGGGAFAYTTTGSTFAYLYKEFLVPTGESKLSLSFKFKKSSTDVNDKLVVYVCPTSSPLPSTSAAALAYSMVDCGINPGSTTNWTTVNAVLPQILTQSGASFRLLFCWQINGATTQGDPAAVDEISLVSSSDAVSVITTKALGNWNATTTWTGGVVPSVGDPVQIGHAVTTNATNCVAGPTTVISGGSIIFGSLSGSNLNVSGDLTINSGGAVTNINGKILNVLGNIVHNGNMDFGQIGAAELALCGFSQQTVSGAGTFTAGTGTFHGIQKLSFKNNLTTTPSTPNIIWSINDTKIIAFTFGLLGGKPNYVKLISTDGLTPYRMYNGDSVANLAGTVSLGFTSPAQGFTTGSIINRYITTLGNSLGAGADQTTGNGSFHFVSSDGSNRAAYYNRVVAGTGENIEMKYTDPSGAGITKLDGLDGNPAAVTDASFGPYTINQRYNGYWTISAISGTSATNAYKFAFYGTNGLYSTNGNARVMYATTALPSTTAHQNGTPTPFVMRTGLVKADLLNKDLYIGIGDNDAPFVSRNSGSWKTASTWNKSGAPTISDAVTIAPNHTIELDQPGSVAKSLTVSSAAALNMVWPNADLTIGNTKKDALINNGTITISGSNTILNINGYLLSNNGSAFSQSDGTVIIDGNDGNTANSVATGTRLCYLKGTASSISLTGGKIQIKNPHIGSANDDNAIHVEITGALGSASVNHTVEFGPNGGGTIAGGGAQGFSFKGDKFVYGTVRVNNSSVGTVNNRHAGPYAFGITETTAAVTDLIIETGGKFRSVSKLFVGRNLTNNGIFVTTQAASHSLLAMAGYDGASSAQLAGFISGSGEFQNNDVLASATSGIHHFTINNPNGVTLSRSLEMMGNLTLTSGILTTSAGTLVMGGTAGPTPSSGTTASVVTSYVNGPLTRIYPAGTTNTNYFQFPVGKDGVYAPIQVALTPTATTAVRSEYYNTAGGTAENVQNLASDVKWSVTPAVAGSVTDMNVKIGSLTGSTNLFASATPAKIPVSSDELTGTYTNTFGDFATFASGTPNTWNSNTASPYREYISFAEASFCETPAPGDTVASSLTVCTGESTTLSLQNATMGMGVTYQWLSSPDGTTWDEISGATTATYEASPTIPTHYRCDVTCASESATVSSNEVTISMTYNINPETPPSHCGTTYVTFNATATAGATVKWYNSAVSSTAVATGTSFTTPTPVSTDTTYYVAAETTTTGESTILGGGKPTHGIYINTGSNGHIISSSKAVVLKSFDIIPTTTNAHHFVLYGTSGFSQGVPVHGAYRTEYVFTPTTAMVSAGVPVSVPVNFSIPAGATNYWIRCQNDNGLSTEQGPALSRFGAQPAGGNAYPYTKNGFSVTGETNSPLVANSNIISFFNWKIEGQLTCASARVPVTAVVTASDPLTLSNSTVNTCEGSSSAPVTITANVGDYDQFVWNPSTGVSGNSATGWIFNPITNTNYDLVSSRADGCGYTTSLTVVVNPTPLKNTVVVSSNQYCPGDPVVSMAMVPTNTVPAIWWAHEGQTQSPATAYDVLNCNGIFNGLLGAGALNTNDTSKYSLVAVHANTKYTLSTSLSSNYLVIMNADGTAPLAAGTGSVVYNSSAAGQVRFYVYDTTSGYNAGINVQFSRTIKCEPLAAGPSWSPVTDLYTDAETTLPYTGGVAFTVYAKPSATTTYTSSLPGTGGCTFTTSTPILAGSLFYRDADSDGHGDHAVSMSACSAPAGFVPNDDDCDDTTASITTATTLFYRDADGDGFGNYAVTTTGCTAPTGFVHNDQDCDDTSDSITIAGLFYRDADGDGFGNPAVTTTACSVPSGYVTNDDDCDDSNDSITVGSYTFYRDADGDGHGNQALTTSACSAPTGYVAIDDDCDDTDASVFGAPTITQQPLSITRLCNISGATATVTVDVAASANAVYSWQSQAPGLSEWITLNASGSYSGVNTPTLAITKTVAIVLGTKYKLVVQDVCGTIESDYTTTENGTSFAAAKGIVALNAATTPTNTICVGSSAKLKVTSSKGDVQFQYIYSATAPTTFTVWNDFGSVIPSLDPAVVNGAIIRDSPLLTDAGVYYFRTKVTSGTCSVPVYSLAFKVTVSTPVEAGTLAGEKTVCAYQAPKPLAIPPFAGMSNDAKLTLSGNTEITAPVKVLWYKSTNYGTAATPIWIAVTNTTNELNVANLTVSTWYKAKLVNGACFDESNVIKVTVTPIAKPGIITARTNGITTATVCLGGDITYSLTGYVGSSIQWQKSETTNTDIEFTDIPDETNNTLTLTNIEGAAKRKFYVRAIVRSSHDVDGCTVAKTAVKTITVDAWTKPGTVTGGGPICSGGTSKVLVAGHLGKVQWYYSENGGSWYKVPYMKLGVLTTLETLPTTFTTTSGGGTGTSYTVTNITGDVSFRGTIKNGQCNVETTNEVTYNVDVDAVKGSIDASTTLPLCNTTGTTLTLRDYTGNYIQWQKYVATGLTPGWVNISGATKATLTTGNLAVNTKYKVIVTIRQTPVASPCKTVESDEFEVTVKPKVIAKTITASASIPSGTTELNAICTDVNTKKLTMGAGYTAAASLTWQTIVSRTAPSAIAAGWADIDGANSASYTIANPQPERNWFRVKLVYDGCTVYSPAYSVWYKTCGIGRPAEAPAMEMAEVTSFKVVAYPNPYTENFRLSLSTSSDARIGLKVYDMIGRQIEQREFSPSEISELQLGNGWPSGIYNVNVIQGTEIRSLRLIKQ